MEGSFPQPDAEPQATSQTDPAPVAPGGHALGEEAASPPAEAAPAEQPPVDGAADAAASEHSDQVDEAHAPEGDPENYDAERVPGDQGTPVGFDASQPAPAAMMTEDGLRQHGEISPGLGSAPIGDTTDLPEERPSTAGVSEPEQIETERPDIGTPGV